MMFRSNKLQSEFNSLYTSCVARNIESALGLGHHDGLSVPIPPLSWFSVVHSRIPIQTPLGCPILEVMVQSSFPTMKHVIGKPMNSAPNLEEKDAMHEKMMEVEPLLEASGERNLRSIDITHGDCPYHCLAQTVWYPEHANLCLVWDVEKIRSIGLPDHR